MCDVRERCRHVADVGAPKDGGDARARQPRAMLGRYGPAVLKTTKMTWLDAPREAVEDVR